MLMQRRAGKSLLQSDVYRHADGSKIPWFSFSHQRREWRSGMVVPDMHEI
jgi:hypothetical protein